MAWQNMPDGSTTMFSQEWTDLVAKYQGLGYDKALAVTLANREIEGWTGVDPTSQQLTPTFTSLGTGINPLTGQRESIGGQGQWDEGTAQDRFLTSLAGVAGGALLAPALAGGAAGGAGAAATAPLEAGIGTSVADLTSTSVAGATGATAAGTAAGAAPIVSNFAGPVSGVSHITGGPLLAGAGGAALAGQAGGSPSSGLANSLGISPETLGLLGIAGATGLGVYGANQQSGALENIAAQARADREPFRQTSLSYLADPQAYISGPGKASMDATLRALSAKWGNPIDQPTALGIATQAGLRDWRDAVTGFGNLGLGGQDSRNQILAGAANAQSGVYDALGYGLRQATQPRSRLAELYGLY